VVEESRVRHAEENEILESVFVEMDPAIHGFAGVFLDLWREGEQFVFTETAAGTGNRLLVFSSRTRELAYRIWLEELGAYGSSGAPIVPDALP
jgi:hypothetical protein